LVSASGAEPSGRIDVEPFAAVGGINSELTVMGMATTNISNGVNGEVISFGTLTGLDTRGDTTSAIAVGDETWAAGDILFAHPTVAGKLTKVRPQHDLAVAFITVRHASTGQIAVRIAPGNNHLEWMHDVLISGSVQNNELLAYDLSSNLWINQTADEAGLSSSSHNHTLDSLSNVEINSLTDGESIVWSSASSAWINQVASGGATTNVSETAPESAEIGDSWYKQSTGSFFIYDGSYWVEVTSVITMSNEEAQDRIAPLFNHSNHSNIIATYDDINNQILLSASATPDLSSYLTQSSASTTYAKKDNSVITGGLTLENYADINLSNSSRIWANNGGLYITSAGEISLAYAPSVNLPENTSIGNVSGTEIDYLNNASANIQTQLNSKLSTSSASTTYQNKVFDIVAAKTSAYTFASGDENKIIELDGTFTVTIPSDSTFNFPIGTYINILQITSGTITIAGAGGVTVNGSPGLKLNSQWSGASIIKRSSNTWVAVGDLAA
jgi:hypothetical protein